MKTCSLWLTARHRVAWLWILSVALSLAVAPGAAQGQDLGPQVSIAVSVEREITRTQPDGTQVVETEPVEEAVPGDVLVYTLSAHNSGATAAHGVRLQDPIPTGTALVLDSVGNADGVRVDASLDSGDSWQPFPARVRLTADDGQVQDVPAPPEAYTSLRWVLLEPLFPGETRDVRFKVQIR